jgi:hypothetical protein
MFSGLFRKNIKLIRRVSVAKLPPRGSVLGLITAYHQIEEFAKLICVQIGVNSVCVGFNQRK